MLQNSNFVRPITVGNWNQLRVCVRISITDQGAATMSNPGLSVGFCCGSSSLFLSGTVQHFVGFTTIPNTGTLNVNKVAGPPFYIAERIYPVAQVGAGRTYATDVGVPGTALYCDAYIAQVCDGAFANPYRSLFFVDIIRPNGATNRTSGNYIIKIYNRAAAAPTYDATNADFLTHAILADPGAPAITNHIWSDARNHFSPGSALTTDITLPVNELENGEFNHVSVSWDQTVADIEVSEWGFVKLS